MDESIHPRAALRYPGFRSFQVARSLTVIALEMQSVAVGWQLFELTHRPLDLGLAGLAQFLPGLLLIAVTGPTADRIRRERIIRACLLGALVTTGLLLSYSVLGGASPWPIYGILLGSGVVRAFHGPAGQSLLPLLVERRHFPNAVAWSSSFFQGSTIIGPVLGGVLYALTDSAKVVYATAWVALFGALMAALRIRPVLEQKPSGGRALADVLAGFAYVARTRAVLGAISLDLFAVLLGGAVALLPVYAKEILMAGPWGLGLLRAAPGVGAVTTALLLAHRPLTRRAGPVMLACVAGFGMSTLAFGLSRSLPLSLLALVLLGAFDMVSVIVRGTIVQLHTPDEMRGRVSSVNMLFIGASNELGQFESGLTAQWFGAVPAVLLGGLGSLAVVSLWSILFPELRRIDRLTEIPVQRPRATEAAATGTVDA